MQVFNENCVIYSEVLNLLRNKAQEEKQRNIDPELKLELDNKAETIHKNLKIIHKDCLSHELAALIAKGFKNKALTVLPKGSILLFDYIELCGYKLEHALETLNKSNFIISKIETRGNKRNKKRRFPNYDIFQTIVLPPKDLHHAILLKKTIYHVCTIGENEALDKNTHNEVYGTLFEPSLFDEIIELNAPGHKSILGIW